MSKNKIAVQALASEQDMKNNLNRWKNKFAESNNKNPVDRETVVSNTKSLNNVDGVEIVNPLDNEWEFLQIAIESNASTNLEINNIVHIEQDVAGAINEGTFGEIPTMADDDLREGTERGSGLAAEVAFQELARDLDVEVKSLIDDTDEHIYVGDFLVDGYITEVKSAQTSSKAQNITHRNHGQPNTAQMYIKNGIYPELYVHSVVLDLTDRGKGIFVGFVGGTPVLPQYDGLYTQTPRVMSHDWATFMINDISDLSWYNLITEWTELESQLEKINLY